MSKFNWDKIRSDRRHSGNAMQQIVGKKKPKRLKVKLKNWGVGLINRTHDGSSPKVILRRKIPE